MDAEKKHNNINQENQQFGCLIYYNHPDVQDRTHSLFARTVSDVYLFLDGQRQMDADDVGRFFLPVTSNAEDMITPTEPATKESLRRHWKQSDSSTATPPPPPPRARERLTKKAKKTVASSAKPSIPSQISLSKAIDLQRCPDNPFIGGSLMSSRSDNTAGEERAELLMDKDNRHRQRNREAAQKYRIRKISSTQKLATDVATLEVANSSLKREAACLRREILCLKDMVLQHADCDCSYVQTYIKLAASKLAAEMAVSGNSDAATPRFQGLGVSNRLSLRHVETGSPVDTEIVSKALNNTITARGWAPAP